jgi:hypothetical protein
MNYNDYRTTIHPAHFGDGFTSEERSEVTRKITARLETKFPGLRISVSDMEGAVTPTRGPIESVIEEIDYEAGRAFESCL